MADQHGLTVVLLAPASSVHTRRWASALAGSGHRVIVASWQPGPPLRGADIRIAPAVRAVPVSRVPLAVSWLRYLVTNARPDVVHVHSLGAHGLLSLALPRGPARVVTPWGSELRAAQHSAARAAVVRLALRRADLLLPTSATVAAELTSGYAIPAARAQVLSWGVSEALIAAHPSIAPDAVRSDFGIPSGATVVLSIRSASATYRTGEIVSAFARAAAGRPDLFLVVLAGHRPDGGSARRAKEGYLGLVRNAAGALPGRVLIVERTLTPGQTFELMCACDIAVSVPSSDQRSSSVLEAALAGCRLLLSDIAPYREMIRDGLAADLLAEPIRDTLAQQLRAVWTDDVSARSNRKFILTHEHGADKAAMLEQIYRQLSALSR